MQILYIDNFRGFSKTEIQLKRVNFLVGENSTGKTSVLSLINLLSNFKLWFLEFQFEDSNLGNFEDLVSYNSKDKSYFAVGAFESAGKGADEGEMFLLTFGNDKGLPVCKKYSYVWDHNLIHVTIERNFIAYKAISLKKKKLSPKSFFKESSEEHKNLTGEYIKLSKDFFNIKPPLAVVRSYIAARLSQDTTAKRKSSPIRMNFFKDMAWIAPIREKPKKSYDQYKISYSPEGMHTPYLLNDAIGDRRKTNKPKSLLKALEKFGLDSGLFKTIKVKRFGKHRASPFEVEVVLESSPLGLSNVGYGVSQVLPIIVEASLRTTESRFAIQQPEVHLHPRAQASLGGYIHALAKDEHKVFFVETHSDFLIDRFRLLQKKKGSVDAQVLFFERDKAGNKVHCIEIDKSGKYVEHGVKGFKDFFIKEELNLLSL